ncbi:MAG: hypothetical protein RJA70_1197 [Pseudomonadota bacterium]|jgi:hypothetical protein
MKTIYVQFVKSTAAAACVVGIAMSAVTGCGDGSDPDGSAEPEAQKTGSVGFALTGSSSSGQSYRVVGDIVVSGTESLTISTEEHLDQPVVSRDLPAGGYLAALEDWTLEALAEDGTWSSIRARLTSTNPLPFVVTDQQTTDVTFTFRAGDQLIELGNGRVHFGIAVEDDATGPQQDCAQTCAIAEMMVPDCINNATCQFICEQLVSTAPPDCVAISQAYEACAQGVPGEAYVCFLDYPVASGCEMLFSEVLSCYSQPPPPCMVDDDGDGFCSDVDCNDTDPAVNPGAFEQCNQGVDTNCDGMICQCDDADGDGSCAEQDCNDQDASISPLQGELCDDGVDQDCDGVDLACPPVGWTCDPAYLASGDGCDCGCGLFDPDCVDSTPEACLFCNDPGSCSEAVGCAAISPEDNSTCL